jgi:hypothetical protein
LTGLNYESFIGFDLSGLPEQEFIYSKLVLTLPRVAKPSEIPLEIHKLSSDQPWTETGITHANRPRDTSLLYTLVPEGTKVEVDLQGSFEEVYVLKSEELYRFFSKESGKGPYIEVAFIDPDAFREIEGRYLQIAYTAQRPVNSDFKLEWDGTLPYGESVFRLSYELSNIFLLTYAADPKFIVSFVVQRVEDADFSLSFASRQRSTNDFGLNFTAVGHGENLFGFDFVAAEFEDFALEYKADPHGNLLLSFGAQENGEHIFPVELWAVTASDFAIEFRSQKADRKDFGLAFGAQSSGESDFVVELEAVPNENFPLSFAAQADGTGEFLISFTPRQTSSAEVSLEFEAVSARSFGIEFAAQGHEALDITLEWEALQRYFSDLRLEWVAGDSGAAPAVVLHESGCLKVLDAGVLVQGILITDTDDALLEQVVLRRVEDSDGSGCDWKSHLGLK